MIGFRFHRPTVQEAMQTYEEFTCLEDLYIRLSLFCAEVLYKDLDMLDFYIDLYGSTPSNPLGADERIGWKNTFIVGGKKIGVLGFMTILYDDKKKIAEGRSNW